MNTRRLTLMIAALGATAVPARADAYSGFTKPRGAAYVKVAFSTFTSHDFYDLSGRLNGRGEDFTQRNLGIYAEYGIIDRLTVIANIPALRLNSYANTNTAAGIGDVQLSLKYGLEVLGFHVAASVGPEIPLGDSDATVQTDSGLNLVLPTGDGELNVWTKLAVSRSFGISAVSWLDGWVSAGAGYNLRTEGFADQIGFGGEVGARVAKVVFVQLRARAQVVPSDDLDTARGFIYGEGTEFVTIGAGVAVQIPETPMFASFDWEQPIAARQNLYSGPVLVAGLAVAIGG